MRRFFPLLILVFSVSSLLIFLFGDSGLLSYDDLDVYREQLAANVASLEARHAMLDARLAQLRDDPAAVRVLARDLGLYLPGEEVIKLEAGSRRPELNAIGDLLKHRRRPETRTTAIKAAGVGLALALLAWAMLRGLAARMRAHADSGR